MRTKKQISTERVLIVGINPSSIDSTKTSISIKRLCKWTEQMGIKYYSFVNCVSFPGKYTEKDIEYKFLSDCAKGYKKVLALGGFPSKALSKIGIEHFILPHPSGLNRKLNDREYEKKMLSGLKEYLHGND